MKNRSDDPSHHERTLLPRSYISLLAKQIDNMIYFILLYKHHFISKRQLQLRKESGGMGVVNVNEN